MLDDLHDLTSRARSALAQKRAGDAMVDLREAARHTHVAEQDYAPVARLLGDALEMLGDTRGALTARWCVAVNDANGWASARRLDGRVPPVDRARTLWALGDPLGAAQAMEEASLPAAAAIFREKARDWKGARALWSRLSGIVPHATASDAYIAALVQFNLGRCAASCGDASQAHGAFVAAVRLLEEAADTFESSGVRERAFDCFQVLVEIGHASQQFEHVLEGYINCVRILREDHLKYYALQYYEDAAQAARAATELVAAATIAREAADYARSLGMKAASAQYALEQAESWRSAAKQHTRRGSPPEIAENSLLAAILAYGQLGQFARAGALYRDLASMDLEPSRKAHYERAAKRYDDVRDEPLEAAPLPTHLRHDARVVEVWHVDLVEWEQRGSAAEACAEIVLDGRWPDPIRRQAMIARLTALGTERDESGSQVAIEGRARLAGELAQVPLFVVLSPLERLFARPERAVKLAVLVALKSLFFKRSLTTVVAATREPDPVVAQQAGESLKDMVFPHAFDPLARVVRESNQANARVCALTALAQIETPAAAELLLGVLEHGAPTDRDAVRRVLHGKASRAFLELARNTVRTAPAPLQQLLREALGAHGSA